MVICGWRPATDSLTLLSSAIARNYSKQARRVDARPAICLAYIDLCQKSCRPYSGARLKRVVCNQLFYPNHKDAQNFCVSDKKICRSLPAGQATQQRQSPGRADLISARGSNWRFVMRRQYPGSGNGTGRWLLPCLVRMISLETSKKDQAVAYRLILYMLT